VIQAHSQVFTFNLALLFYLYIIGTELVCMMTLVGVQVKLREMKPGMLSHDLKEALGMPEGAPPPWLINMQVRTVSSAFFVDPVLALYIKRVLFFSPEIWSSTILPSAEDPRTECSHTRWS
jgi:hypothetical protein